MLEATLIRDDGTPFAFQFENDALQAFLTECSASESGVRIASLRALGVPLMVTGDELKAKSRTKAEAEAIAADAKAKVNQPITRTAGPGSVRSETPAKPTTERK